MHTAETTLQKSPKAKKIEDIVKPDATMRLHQRLFDRRRKHHIDVQDAAAESPGASLDAYLIPARYRKKSVKSENTTDASALTTTTPMPVLRYSEITRDLPEESYLATDLVPMRSFFDRIAQRYRIFVSQHKPFYYSLSAGTASGWLKNPRARVALAGSALVLLLFFTGKPYTPPTGPDNPTGQNPIVIQDTSRENPVKTTGLPPNTSPSNTETSPGTNNVSAAPSPTTPTNPTANTIQSADMLPNGGGYGSGPMNTSSPTTTTPTSQTSTPTSTNLIQDVIKPTPVTIPGQDIKIDDKRVLQTSDTTITIN